MLIKVAYGLDLPGGVVLGEACELRLGHDRDGEDLPGGDLLWRN